MINILAFDCTQETLKIVYLIKVAFEVIKMVVPILLIIMCLIDSVKHVMSKDGWDKKIIKKIVSKFIAAVLVYFVPTMINMGLSVMGEANFTLGTCWKNATKENTSVNVPIEDTTKGSLEKAKDLIDKALEDRKKIWGNEGE
ncbi:MAG: hypothetical protein PHN72_06490 [Bacilli bacterium]|nr:hypothetical protein [Bacilli bacterium]